MDLDSLKNIENELDKQIIAELLKVLPLVKSAYSVHRATPTHTTESLSKVAQLSEMLESDINSMFNYIQSGSNTQDLESLTSKFESRFDELMVILKP